MARHDTRTYVCDTCERTVQDVAIDWLKVDVIDLNTLGNMYAQGRDFCSPLCAATHLARTAGRGNRVAYEAQMLLSGAVDAIKAAPR